MKKVKNLTVQVTYRVGLGNVKMPDEVYEQLSDAAEDGRTIEAGGEMYTEAAEWLSNNIRERDCMDWEAEIQEIS